MVCYVMMQYDYHAENKNYMCLNYIKKQHNMQKELILILFLVIFWIFVFSSRTSFREGFNESVGRLCHSCGGKTFNQCTDCFNCGFCIDKYGNSRCVGGDHKGPYNYEDCEYWYSGDQYARMIRLNKDYKCSYGPHQSSRIY